MNMLLLYICAGTGVTMIFMAIIIMVALMGFKDPSNTPLILWYDDLIPIAELIIFAGCFLIGVSAILEVHMLG